MQVFVPLSPKVVKVCNNRSYKIVICAPSLYSIGGVERVVSVKANYFADVLGFNVTIIVTEGIGRISYFPLSERIKVINLGLDFEELWHQSFYKKVLLYIKKQRLYKKLLTSELMRIHPDITISVLRREINFITEIKDGSKKVGELHVNRKNYRNFREGESNVLKHLFAKFWAWNLLCHLRKLDKMVVLTDCALDDWPELNNMIKIPDPLPFRLGEKSCLAQNRVISIGRYDYDKGNDLLLQVWTYVEKLMLEWQLDIYGDGCREPYQILMEQLGVDSSRCHLFGPVSDVKQEYLKSSVFVLPSRFEGFGLVLIEAMACGVPVVSFDCENGPRSIITDGFDGFLISPFDVKAFAEKVILLMKNENLRREMGENARRSAAKYDIDIVGQQWKQLFDELMENR